MRNKQHSHEQKLLTGIILLQLLVIFFSCSSAMAAGKKITNQINPHWKESLCKTCHNTGKPSKGNLRLKIKNKDKLCKSCHKNDDHNYIHLIDVPVPNKMLKHMPAKMKAASGAKGKKLRCGTCHDTVMQCTPKLFSERYGNSQFLRGKNPQKRTDFCYQCHDKKAYAKLNPHDQKSDSGKIYRDKCLICHVKVPEQQGTKKVKITELRVKKPWYKLCKNCHRVGPHPGDNTRHLVKPSAKVLKRLRMMTPKNQIMFPMEPGTGHVYCATCHNPHERGIIKNKLAAKGADEKHRLRSNYVCENCHDK